MYKILLLLSLVISSVFAQVDANLEVVKKTNALPKMLVSVATDSPEVETLNKIKKSLADDLSVSGHFEVVSVNSVTSYENMPDIIGLSNQGINLYLNLSAKKEADSYTLMTKLYDINSRTLILEKNFATTQNQLIDDLHYDKGVMTRTIQSLEQKGFVQRADNPLDSRSFLLNVTEQAVEFKPVLINILKRWHNFILLGFDEATLDMLNQSLIIMAENAADAMKEEA